MEMTHFPDKEHEAHEIEISRLITSPILLNLKNFRQEIILAETPKHEIHGLDFDLDQEPDVSSAYEREILEATSTIIDEIAALDSALATKPKEEAVQDLPDDFGERSYASFKRAAGSYQRPAFQCLGDWERCRSKHKTKMGKAMCLILFAKCILISGK